MSESIRRVAVIFDDRPRADTTGGYCLRALQALCHAHHFRPDQLSKVPAGDFDLFLRVDDGLDAAIPAHLRPLAWWAIDTHVSWQRCLRVASLADRTFAAQRPGVDSLRRAGLTNAEWLPLACDPSVHRPRPAEKRYDFGFVGNLNGGPREELLDRLKHRYRNHWVGQAYFDDMAKIYSSSRIVFNRSVADDLNMRVFEALACGTLLTTNTLPEHSGQEYFFQDGIHLATYSTPEELFEKIDFFLRRPALRAQVEAQGLAVVLEHHTYRHRMEALLETMSLRPVSVSISHTSPTALQDPGYFDHARPELLALVPTNARRVLEIGCGRGRLGASLKARQAAHVTGWELNPGAASIARTRLDDVLDGDIESSDHEFEPGSFDVILCGDVLEHLRDPASILKRLHRWLAGDGRLIASLPNVMHHSVVRGLLAGDWTYEPAGLLDQTHLRFFTKREIEKLLTRTGFRCDPLIAIPGPGYEAWSEAGRPPEVALGGLRIATPTLDRAEEFFTYQWVAVAHPIRQPDYGLTSIIILTYNQIEYTAGCLESLRFYTDGPYELIIVDNGSRDGTPRFLSELADSDPSIHVILNSENRGFPAGVNQGLKIAQGRQFVLLNNDTLLTTGWLTRLLAALHSAPNIGMAGPCSNRISGPQQIAVDYETDLVGLDGFAWARSRTHAGRTERTDRLVGFCLAIHRKVWEQVGDFDERFGIGNFEDDDYCRRVMKAGYELRIAHDAFVHHYGSASFRGANINFGRLMSENREKYHQKWNSDTSEAIPNPSNSQVVPTIVPAEPSGHLTLHVRETGGWELLRERPRLSVCLIVRDNASTIKPCLESIRPWVDEIIVVDTGSLDETASIAAELGAQVHHFPWCDDFSAARNESFRLATGEWLFWMDSDDTIPSENGRRLRELATRKHKSDVHGYVVQVHCPGPGPRGHLDTTVVDHVKLVRNLPELRFEGRIHEQILPAIRRIGGEIEWTDLYVVHSGYDHSPAGQYRKRERDLRLLHLDLKERPGHPFALFNLGMTYTDLRQYAEGADYLRQSLKAADPGESHVRKTYALLVYCLMQTGATSEAISECEKALSIFPEDLELTFRYALILQHDGRKQEAASLYEKILASAGKRHFTSVDRGIGGYKARQNLAVLSAEMGNRQKALDQWKLIVEEVPEYRMGWRGYSEQLLQMGMHETVAELADKLSRNADSALRAESQLLLGRLRMRTGDRTGAIAMWDEASQIDPLDAESFREIASAAYASGEWVVAERSLRNAAERDADDPRIWHNLGATLLNLDRRSEAADALRESLRIRPNHPETNTLLLEATRPDVQR